MAEKKVFKKQAEKEMTSSRINDLPVARFLRSTSWALHSELLSSPAANELN